MKKQKMRIIALTLSFIMIFAVMLPVNILAETGEASADEVNPLLTPSIEETLHRITFMRNGGTLNGVARDIAVHNVPSGIPFNKIPVEIPATEREGFVLLHWRVDFAGENRAHLFLTTAELENFAIPYGHLHAPPNNSNLIIRAIWQVAPIEPPECDDCNAYPCECPELCNDCNAYPCECPELCNDCNAYPCECPELCDDCNAYPCECSEFCDYCNAYVCLPFSIRLYQRPNGAEMHRLRFNNPNPAHNNLIPTAHFAVEATLPNGICALNLLTIIGGANNTIQRIDIHFGNWQQVTVTVSRGCAEDTVVLINPLYVGEATLTAVFLPELSDWITIEEQGSWIWAGRYVDFAVNAAGLPAGSYNITNVSFEYVGTGYLPTRRGVGGPPSHHIPGEVDVLFSPVSFIVNENGIGTMSLFLQSSSVPRPGRVWDLELTVTVESPEGPLVSEAIKTVLTDPGLWELYWADEFDGDAVNTEYWHFQIGLGHNYGVGNGWGNYEAQFYRPENMTVENGHLVIEARHYSTPQTHPGAPGSSNWTSGRMRSTGATGINTTYGRIEAGIRLPVGEGLWPAFWMMPEYSIYGGWAASGEIDIMESRGRETDRTSGAIHFGGQWPQNTFSAAYYRFPDYPNNSIDDFHTFAVEWEPGEIRWYVNDTLFWRENRWHSRAIGQQADFTYPAPFDIPFHMILNLAIGGRFDGMVLPDPNFVYRKYVDYVRVWHQNESVRPLRYPIHPDDLALIPDPIPEDAKYYRAPGGLIWDTNFGNVHLRTGSPGASPYNPDMPGNSLFPFFDGWVVGSFAGGGNVSGYQLHTVNGQTFIEVQIQSAGVPYGNQLMQRVPLVHGRHYRLSFDAWADAERTIQVNIAQGGVGGWTNHTPGGGAFNLTTNVQSFSRYFTMTNPTQLDARLEFNLGASSHNVYVGNVRLVEIDYIPLPEDNILKFPLAGTGSLIWNGTFDQSHARMAFWGTDRANGATANMAVNANRQFEVSNISNTNNPADLILRQNRIPFFNDTYRISFEASVPSARDIQFRIVSMTTGNVFYTGTVSLDATMQRYTVDFRPSPMVPVAVAGYEVQFQFLFGGSSTGVIIDNVLLTRLTFEGADWSDVTIYPLFNGDFFATTPAGTPNGWVHTLLYGGAGNVSVANNVATVNVTSVGTVPWSTIFLTQPFEVHDGFVYNLTFDVRGAERDIEVLLETPPWGNRRFDTYQFVRVTDEWTTHNFSWSEGIGGLVELKFFLGATGGAINVPGAIEFRNVNVYLRDGALFYNKIPTFIPDTTNNTLGNAIILQYNAAFDTGFSATARTIQVNGTTVSFTSPEPGTIVLAANAFTAAGMHVITISAPGFESRSINQLILEGDLVCDNLVFNGDFALPINLTGAGDWAWVGENGWSVMRAHEATISSAVTGPNGLELTMASGGIDNWFAQLCTRNEQTIILQPGEEYIVTVEASASVPRPVLLSLAAGTRHTLNLTTEPQTFTFTITGALTYNRVTFYLGGNVPAVYNPVVPVPSAEHTIYFHEVRIVPAETEPPVCDQLVFNSDFSLPIDWTPAADWVWAGSNGWMMMRANNGLIPSVTTGADGLAMTITPGTSDWFVQLSTQGRNETAHLGQEIILSTDTEYVVTIEARSSVPRPVIAAITAGGNGRNLIELTEEWQTFTFNIAEAQTLFLNRITFYMGGNIPAIFNPTLPTPTEQHTVYFRLVSIMPVTNGASDE